MTITAASPVRIRARDLLSSVDVVTRCEGKEMVSVLTPFIRHFSQCHRPSIERIHVHRLPVSVEFAPDRWVHPCSGHHDCLSFPPGHAAILPKSWAERLGAVCVTWE